MVAEQDGDRQLGRSLPGDLVLEDRCLVELAADHEPDHDDDRAGPEGDPPPPRQQLVLGERGDRQEHRRGQDLTGLGAAEGEARVVRAPVVGGVLQAHRVRARLLTRGGEPLQQPGRDQQDRRGDADAVVGRQAADQERRETHEQQRGHQHALAAEPVADVPEEHRADRAGEVADAERRQRQQRARGRVRRREEDLAEDEGRGGAVDEEVVVLQRAPDPRGDGRLARFAGRGRGTGGVSGHEGLLCWCSVA